SAVKCLTSRSRISRPRRSLRSTLLSTTERNRRIDRSSERAARCRPLCYTGSVVKRVVLVLPAVVVAALLAVGRAPAQPAWAGQCGIPANQTVWADYSWSTLLPVMARRGTVLALTNGSSGTDYSAQARALGAATYSFDLHLARRVGTPDAPADPATIEAAA